MTGSSSSSSTGEASSDKTLSRDIGAGECSVRGEKATGLAMMEDIGVRGQSASPLAILSARKLLLVITCVSYRDLFS